MKIFNSILGSARVDLLVKIKLLFALSFKNVANFGLKLVATNLA